MTGHYASLRAVDRDVRFTAELVIATCLGCRRGLSRQALRHGSSPMLADGAPG